ncbi:MAG: retropepsin-like domain-containing protein [candidate division KSB1 bacterium]|nr:retropepsin-like domain-containing protein [candidate division KSB1 bacterium]
MAIIAKKLKLVGSKGEKELEGLFDSGSTYSCIERKLAESLATLEKIAIPLEFETAEKKRTIVAKEAVRLDFYLNGYRFSDEFMVIPNLSEEVIIGASTMQKWRFKLDFENEEVIIDPRVTKFRLLQSVKAWKDSQPDHSGSLS